MRLDGQVAVIGVGSVGSMALWRTALRSRDVVGFEAAHSASDRTAVGGDTRLFRRAYQEGAKYSGLLAESERLFLELNDSGGTAFIPCGGLSIGARGGSYMSALGVSISETAAEHSVLEHDELRARYPQHQLLPDDFGIFDPHAGAIRTDQAVLTAVERAKQAGAVVKSHTRIRSVVSHSDHVEISSESERWRFASVVIAGGAWSSDLLPERVRSGVYAARLSLSWFLARDAADYLPERFPIFIRESGGVHIYGAPSVDGATVKVSGMTPHTRIEDPDQLVRDLSDVENMAAIDAVSQFLPGLHPAPVRADSYPELYSPDDAPLVGWVDEMPGVYVATGFSGRGFKIAPGVGETIAREILGGAPSLELAFLSPQRTLSP